MFLYILALKELFIHTILFFHNIYILIDLFANLVLLFTYIFFKMCRSCNIFHFLNMLPSFLCLYNDDIFVLLSFPLVPLVWLWADFCRC
jgi:hypothetical protein